MRLGVIADTHGLIRPEALAALKGSDHIVHAGDIGRIEVIEALEALAPVTAVRGNVDKAANVACFPADAALEVGGRWIYVLHDVAELTIDPSAAGFDLVVSGHSHRSSVELVDGVLLINPGAAGPRRFKLPVTVATVDLAADPLAALIRPLL